MLVTKQPVLRRFWYALMPDDRAGRRPQALHSAGRSTSCCGSSADGTPAALRDRCCHRTAKLSKGYVENGNIVCGYHGWTYDCTGTCVKIPQQPELQIPAGAKVPAFRARRSTATSGSRSTSRCSRSRTSPKTAQPGYRRIFQFYEEWKTSPLRMMENSFDNSHFSFVHKANFGMLEQPKPAPYEFRETDYGFEAETRVPIRNPEAGHASPAPPSRSPSVTWSTATTCRSRAASAAPTRPAASHHIIYNCATPIDDDRMMLVQWLYRNDSEEHARRRS